MLIQQILTEILNFEIYADITCGDLQKKKNSQLNFTHFL